MATHLMQAGTASRKSQTPPSRFMRGATIRKSEIRLPRGEIVMMGHGHRVMGGGMMGTAA